MRTPLGWLLPVAAALWALAAAPAAAGCEAPDIAIRYAGGVPASASAGFEREMREAVAKVCAWWGESYPGAFRVEVEDSRGPSMALVPAWRGERGSMLFRARQVARGEAATVHEVTHVFAPNANRLLAEGLAVYAHQYLGGPDAYPNFGKALDPLAKPLADKADIAALDRIATPERLELPGLDGKEAYLVAGSFVGFLIDGHGLEKFRALYALTPLVPRQREAGDPARWQQVYGETLEALAGKWRERLGAR